MKSAGRLVVLLLAVTVTSCGNDSGTDATDGTAAAADRSTSPGTSGGDWRDVPTGETNIDDIDPIPTGVDGVAAVAGPGATIELEDGVTLSCEADEFFFQVEGSELPLCGTSPEEMAFMVSPPST